MLVVAKAQSFQYRYNVVWSKWSVNWGKILNLPWLKTKVVTFPKNDFIKTFGNIFLLRMSWTTKFTEHVTGGLGQA